MACIDIALPPSWIESGCKPSLGANRVQTNGASTSCELAPARITEIRSALVCVPGIDIYNSWIEVGQALHSESKDETAFQLWREWSVRGEKHKVGECREKWGTFSQDGGINIETLFRMAYDNGWHRPRVTTGGAAPEVKGIERESLIQPLPNELLKPPGILGDIADFANRTAPRRQPLFAIIAALATVGTLVGRRFRTNHKNYAPLYYALLARTGAGKDHLKSVISKHLDAVDQSRLMGASGFTSEGAVISALRQTPNMVTVIDEIGHELVNVRNGKSMGHAATVQKTLMELYSSPAGKYRGRQYSSMTLSKKEAETSGPVEISNPSLTLVGLSTPDKFLGALDSGDIGDGFLNRFCLLASDLPRQRARAPDPSANTEKFERWYKQDIAGRFEGNLAEVDIADVGPKTIVIPFSNDAIERLDDYDDECIEKANRLEATGNLDGLIDRDREKAMRLSLICALARGERSISLSDVKWSITFVNFATDFAIRAARDHMVDSRFEQLWRRTHSYICDGGTEGRTENEITRNVLRAEPSRSRKEVLDHLRDSGLCASTPRPPPKGRGRPATVWFNISTTG